MLKIVRRVLFAVIIWVIERVVGLRHTQKPLADIRQSVEAKAATLVDVREMREWDAGHLRDAVFLPLSRVRAGIPRDELVRVIPADRPVYLHCGAGGRSLLAGQVLKKLGYEVHPLKPGYEELAQAGFPRAA